MPAQGARKPDHVPAAEPTILSPSLTQYPGYAGSLQPRSPAAGAVAEGAARLQAWYCCGVTQEMRLDATWREPTEPMAAQFKVSNADYATAVRDSFARQGLMTTLGARILTIEPGFCVIEMSYTPGVSQQQGFFHGGAIGTIADSAAGYAAYSLMPAGAEVLTVEFKINLIRPALPPTLRAEGRVLRAGKTLTVCRSDIYHVGPGGPEACALLQSTLMRVDPPS